MLVSMAAALAAAALAAQPGVDEGISAATNGRAAEAVAIWKPLARTGDPEAQYRLAEAYQIGRGVPVDLRRARELYGRAARQCHAPAQASLALLDLAAGRREAALRLFRQAAANNEPRALAFYGLALFNGDGIPVDRRRGYALVQRSAALGWTDARATLSEMDVVMQVGASAQPQVTAASPVTAAPAPTRPAASGDWRVQLGAFRRQGAPQELFAQLQPLLDGKQAFYPAQGPLTALQVGSYSSRSAAQAVCRALGPAQPCVVVPAR